MQNIGEEIVGEFLRVIFGCDFVSYNVYTQEDQGEMDVVGIDLLNRKVYICEVATHLITGLQYVRNGQPDNVRRFTAKFVKSLRYAKNHFKNYSIELMLWSPIVKDQGSKAKNNQMRDIKKIKSHMSSKHKCTVTAIINDKYQTCLDALRAYARRETKEMKSPVLRIMQIEEKLAKHLSK